MSLKTKLIAAIVLLLIAAVGAAGFYSFRAIVDLGAAEAERSREQGEEAIRVQAHLVARTLATGAAPALGELQPSFLASLARSTLEENKNVEWLLIIDEQSGQVVAAAGAAPVKEGDQLTDAIGLRLRREKGSEVLGEVDPRDARRLLYGTNVWFAGSLVGQVRLAISTGELQDRIEKQIAAARARARHSAQKLAIVAGIVVLVGILVGMQQSWRIARPLRALAEQARRIAGGDFQQRVTVTSKDEVGQLGAAFNTMADGLGVLLQEMAGKASMQRELELARSVQALMSPPPEPVRIGPFTLAGRCETATQCGGDWWTYRRLEDERLLVVVGDVTGHGMPAAMVAATARGAVEALSLVEGSRLTPTLVLDAIDRAIRELASSRLLMTCFAMVVDGRERSLHYANAGHVFPYVGRADQGAPLVELRALGVTSNPLGMANKCVREGRDELLPGQVIVLYTDGLVDRLSAHGERFGEKRFRRVLQREPLGGDAGALRDRVFQEMRTFTSDHPADDDVTLVVLSFSDERRQSRVARSVVS